MFSHKTALLERINIAINKKWGKITGDVLDSSSNAASSNGQSAVIDLNHFTHSKNAASIERLDERIAALEHQQDQLLSFINFLVENLPDLVINILHTSQESEKLFHPDAAFAEGCVGSDKDNCCQGKNIPCPTRREQDVLDLLVKGLCAKEIASRLFISETTVITHKKNLKEKFNARNTVELMSKAQAHLSRESGVGSLEA